VVFTGYGLLRRVTHQNWLLLAASYYFYGRWDWRFLSLIAISTIIDYTAGLVIDRSSSVRTRRIALAVSMCANLGLLGFFKYFNFFLGSLDAALAPLGLDSTMLRLNIVLPVGISFYTFQTMSYTIEVYRRQLHATKNLLNFALFVSFFPQLVAGPIERATHLLGQCENRRSITGESIRVGLWLIFWGLWKKVVIADNMAFLANALFDRSADLTPWLAYAGVLAFAFQIYADFSGYSDIARGVSELFGFHLMVNFNLPYFSVNPSDFWRRWHISLSTWLRDYLYVPLGGNRKGKLATYRNLLLTMVLGGLWHGAAWNFVWWGVFHGGLLAVHRWITESRRVVLSSTRWVRAAKMAVMFQLTLVGWLLFRCTRTVERGGRVVDDSWGQILDFIRSPMNGWGIDHATIATFGTIAGFALPLLVVQAVQYKKRDHLFVLGMKPVPRALVFAALVVVFLVWGVQSGSSFIYFQF
jgi:D-alanyl-lipoteichoic acid acyltransferase DltB (MBOAT superfamily)